MSRIFLLSPANCGGARGRLLLSEQASFPLARQIQSAEGAPLGDVFSFVSGLYFRGKLAYARAFARPPRRRAAAVHDGVLIITSAAGLCPADALVTLDALRALGRVEVRSDNPDYRVPLVRTALALKRAVGRTYEIVLLGSIASTRYVDILISIFGERLVFPVEFIGRGDMSRGGLMLRSVAAGRELAYAPVAGSARHGRRPPRLEPIRR